MYSFKVEPQDESKPSIERSMSSNDIRELRPVLEQIAKDEYNFIKPIALYLGDGRFGITDLRNPDLRAIVNTQMIGGL